MWNLLVAFACRVTMKNNLQTNTGSDQLGALHVMFMIGLATVIIHFIFILCGIHPTMFPLHTLVSAYYLAFNTLLPVLLFIPVNCIPQQQYNDHSYSIMEGIIFKLNEASNYLFGPPLTKQPKKQLMKDENLQRAHIYQYSALGTAIGMAACTILRVLDHGMQIQRYPIPIIIGATWGCCGGVLIGVMMMAVLT